MATTICSTFDIITELGAGQGVTNVANPGRDFKVVGIYGTGLGNATITVSKVSAAGAPTQMGVVTLAAGDLNDFPAALDASANRQVTVTDTLRITRGVADSTRCVIRCEAFAAETLVES